MTIRHPTRHPQLRIRQLCIALVATSGSLLSGALLPESIAFFPQTHPILYIKTHFLSSVKTWERKLQKAATIATAQPKLVISTPEPPLGKIVRQVKLLHSEPVIALTFDDGPWPNTTEQVLDILQQHDVKATFFWVGKYLKLYPNIAQKVVDRGHALGNHTWSHSYYQMSEATAAKEIEDTAALIYQTTGVKTSLFRPPGGNLSNGLSAYAQKQNYTVVMWSVDSYDYRVSPSVAIAYILRDVQSGSIVLLHDGGGDRRNTTEALPTIITELKKLGYKFVTVPELFQLQQAEISARSE